MKSFLFIFSLIGQLTIVGQTSLPTFTYGKKDSLTFIQSLPVKVDFVLAYSEESYWWSDTENFRLLTQAGNKWETWTYYKKWNSSSDVYRNKGKKGKKYFRKHITLDSLVVKELFDSLSFVNFWKLNQDSLNKTGSNDISDAVSYKFQIENSVGRQVLECYAPEYFVEKFPFMQWYNTFLRGKDIFKRWCGRHMAFSTGTVLTN